MTGINSGNIETTWLYCPQKSFRNGIEQEKTKITSFIDTVRFQITYVPYGRSMLQRQQEKHPKHIKKKPSGRGTRPAPRCFPPGGPGLQVPVPSTPQWPWPCHPHGPAPNTGPGMAEGKGRAGGCRRWKGWEPSFLSVQICACSYNQTSHQQAVNSKPGKLPCLKLKRILEILYDMQFWPLEAILTLKYQISTLQFNSRRACATTAASLPFLLSFYYHSCANAVVCRTTLWHSSGSLIYRISSCVLPKKYAEWLLSGTEPWFTAWGHEHVCQHTWGSRCAIAWQETMDAAIFSQGSAAKHGNLLIITGCLA